MIRFKKNGNTVTVVEDAAKFKEILNNSNEAAVTLAGHNSYQSIEIYTRFNNSGEFAILIRKDNFDILRYGYGYDQDGNSIKIAPLLLSNNTVKFIAFIPDGNRPEYGHIIPIDVEDGDVLSPIPLEPKKHAVENANDDVKKAYRSELFKLANKLYKEFNVSRKEAFRMAKEQLENLDTNKEPAFKVFEKKPEIDGDMSLEDLIEMLENKDNGGLSALAQSFKKLVKLLTELDTVEGEINKLLNRREKPVDPTPPSKQKPMLFLLELIKDLTEGK